jgi:hypothetical protein
MLVPQKVEGVVVGTTNELEALIHEVLLVVV